MSLQKERVSGSVNYLLHLPNLARTLLTYRKLVFVYKFPQVVQPEIQSA